MASVPCIEMCDMLNVECNVDGMDKSKANGMVRGGKRILEGVRYAGGGGVMSVVREEQGWVCYNEGSSALSKAKQRQCTIGEW